MFSKLKNGVKYQEDQNLNLMFWEEMGSNAVKGNSYFISFRYTNHLDSSIISKEFSIEDEEKLFKLHDKIGNKWSLISK